MFIENLIPYSILAGIVYVVWLLKKKPARPISYLGRGLFLMGCVNLMGHYLLPLPLSSIAFELFLDPLLPIQEAIKINPIAQLMEDRGHLNYYFVHLYSLWSGAALIGFSMDLIPERPLPMKKHLLISFLIPALFFVFHAGFRLISGYTWKIADSGQILWFMFFYFLGLGVCLLAEKLREKAVPGEEAGAGE